MPIHCIGGNQIVSMLKCLLAKASQRKVFCGGFDFSLSSRASAATRDLHFIMTRPRLYFVYILSSRSRNLYTGVTNDVFRRVFQHRNGRASIFTQTYRIHRLVYFERHDDVRRAISREKEIKGWRREKKIALIESINPAWEDLAEKWFSEVQVPRRNAPRDDSIGNLRLHNRGM